MLHLFSNQSKRLFVSFHTSHSGILPYKILIGNTLAWSFAWGNEKTDIFLHYTNRVKVDVITNIASQQETFLEAVRLVHYEWPDWMETYWRREVLKENKIHHTHVVNSVDLVADRCVCSRGWLATIIFLCTEISFIQYYPWSHLPGRVLLLSSWSLLFCPCGFPRGKIMELGYCSELDFV